MSMSSDAINSPPTPSQSAQVAKAELERLQSEIGLCSNVTVDGDDFTIGRGRAPIPTGFHRGTWRRTVNSSLLPRSVSSESRRQMLYAIMEDRIHPLLRADRRAGHGSAVMADYRKDLAPFERVHHVPGGTAKKPRDIIFPVHIAVPILFHTYGKKTLRADGADGSQQTDKSFRGPFIDFLSSERSGERRSNLIETLQKLFADVQELGPVDFALVAAMTEEINTTRADALKKVTGSKRTSLPSPEQLRTDKVAVDDSPWLEVFLPLELGPGDERYRPHDDFVAHGRELAADVAALISVTRGLSRLQRLDFIERCLAYHLSLYMVRLSDVLYRELDRATGVLYDGAPSRWRGEEVRVRFNAGRYRRRWHDEYKETMGRLDEAYIMLPVLNGIEVAIRTALSSSGEAIKTKNLSWTEASELLAGADEAGRARVREVLVFLAGLGHRYVGREATAATLERPIEALFDAIRQFYSEPSRRRYPKDHHRVVFEFAAGTGPQSFLQKKVGGAHFSLGDEQLYMLVLCEFGRRPGERRLALHEFERRLERDLVVPADQAAAEGLRESLDRLGLLERFSDVGEANFLRHPIPGKSTP